MADLQPPRGTHDLLPEDQRRHRHVTETAYDIAGLYGYEEISTPIFEATEVFSRTLGETSDIVTKEMYSFEDKGNRSLTLRPEGTAGVARAFITHLRSKPLPLKFFYRGPMFRYERAQKGRQRQFHQFGVELLGVANELADVEVIAMGHHILKKLGVANEVTLQINTLGTLDDRQAYRSKLVDYLSGHKDKLSEDSLARLERNPLRIFDSKDQGDRKVIEGAPKMTDHLNDASKVFFDKVMAGLDTAGIAYEINPTLVRGLDYYNHTAFEFVTDTLGAQGAVLAGGRYDGLIEQMGGPPTPGIGWAAGVERLALMIDSFPTGLRPIAIIPDIYGPNVHDVLGEAQVQAAQLRHAGFAVHLGFSGSFKKRMNRADMANSSAVVILGDDALTERVAKVKDMETGEQTEVPLSSLEDHLARYR